MILAFVIPCLISYTVESGLRHTICVDPIRRLPFFLSCDTSKPHKRTTEWYSCIPSAKGGWLNKKIGKVGEMSLYSARRVLRHNHTN